MISIKAAAFFLLATTASPTLAAECLREAAVGDVGGHLAGQGHAVAGAAIGRPRAKVAVRRRGQAHR